MTVREVSPSSRHGVERLDRLRGRAQWLQERIRLNPPDGLPYDKAELSALVWVIGIVANLPPPPDPSDSTRTRFHTVPCGPTETLLLQECDASECGIPKDEHTTLVSEAAWEALKRQNDALTKWKES